MVSMGGAEAGTSLERTGWPEAGNRFASDGQRMPAEPRLLPPLGDWQGSAELHPYVVCDVFTATPLEGNQLGVFVDGRSFSGEQMQRIARELNVAETVFLLPAASEAAVAVRIFTPRLELPFAGHPVLGAAFVAAQALGADAVTLETAAGPVAIRFEREGEGTPRGWMDQPVPQPTRFAHEGQLLEALGIEASGLPIESYANGPEHVYVELADQDAVAALAPDMAALASLAVAVNCFAGHGRNWKTRMFYPSAGVPEDPATGSAAGPLAVHLVRHGRIAPGEEIEIRQGHEIGRPSLLYARAGGQGSRIDSVEVGGSAVIVAEGRYRIA